MCTFKKLAAALTLALILSCTSFAGDIPGPGQTPTCPPGEECVVSCGNTFVSDGDIPSPGLAEVTTQQSEFVADPLVGTLLALFGLY